MPAKRINKRRDKATNSHEATDFEIHPIAPKQRQAAKNTNNNKTDQKAAMQIGPAKSGASFFSNILRRILRKTAW